MAAAVRHVRQFVVVGGEKRVAVHLRVDVLHHRFRDAHAVVGGRAAADFVQNDEAVLRGVAENVGHFLHFHHEGTLAGGNIIAGADAGENPIHRRENGAPSRDERPHLRHDGEHRHLPHVGGLARHVRSGDDQDFLVPMVQLRVVGDEHLPFQRVLHHGVAAVFDGNIAVLPAHHGGPHVAILQRRPGEAGEAVHLGEGAGGFLHVRNFRTNFRFHRLVNPKLQFLGLFAGGEGFRLKFFQLRRDVALRIDQGLLADIVRRDGEFVGVGNFEIVAEYVIESDFQLDAGLFFFLFFQFGNIFLAVFRKGTQFIQLCRESFANVFPIFDISCAVLIHGAVQQIKNRPVEAHLGI